MTWPATASEAVDAVFAAFGVPATYTPAGGSAGPVTVRFRRPDGPADFGRLEFSGPGIEADLRASEVAAPARGDVVTVAGIAYSVAAHPVGDELGLVHRLQLRPV